MAGAYGRCVFNLSKRLPNCFPVWFHHFAFPPAMQKSSSFSTSSPTLSILNFSHANTCAISQCAFKKYIFMYLAVPCLSCGSWDLLVAACGIQFSNQGSNLGPLHWERGVLTTGPPRKSLNVLFGFVFLAASGLCCGSKGLSLRHAGSLELPCGLRDLSSPTGYRASVPCIARRILNHWTTREVPLNVLLIFISL